MSGLDRTCCVVDARDGVIVLWHVHTGLDIGMSRMTGAWMLGVEETGKTTQLVAQRRVLATASGQEALETFGIPVSEHIDPDATIKNLELTRDELQASYEDHPNHRTLVAPEWPRLPEPIDMRHPPTVVADEPKQTALAVARWLVTVATTWERIESERLVRKYMPGGADRRPVPVAVREGKCRQG